ncbi:murein biosynthesis integral membrane protein MurJ [Candidatus Purcelliella pentastirinorum]|uniref:Probable lipid II flippase MurJ n=1 Tax=Candidatus Purcelliella pentastirinorum TaxID=472834 RepID=A0AAX3NA87_9ENTR|nr:murein biosynthesis integral membrane protein MurJ [Candidatus Purcelliella pentastirinorum]WDI78380.1 murein biosynthesis integral membrane protein MurJ [Candidatus Purcelliella pentastirinorum]WDR80594.1 murein biosynthesis integral membrane protein MurJ [Candidatus Purcelliella pentastirinorum]
MFKSFIFVSFITCLSRFLGFVRDAVVAYVFGVSIETDAFYIAFKLPNLLRKIFADGSVSQVLVPILYKYKSNKNKKEIKIFLSSILGLFFFILLFIVFLGIINSSVIILFFLPGYSCDVHKLYLAKILFSIMFPYIIFISISSLYGLVLNTWNKYTISSFIPILLNMSMIFFSLFIIKYFDHPIVGLAWSVLFGGCLQFLYPLPFLKKLGLLVFPYFNFRNIKIYHIFYKIIPMMIVTFISQISVFINTILSSYFTTGSVSWIYYAERLVEFPSGVLGVSISSILLPSLSRSFFIKDYKRCSSLIDWGLRLCFLLALPATVALIILSGPIILILFQYGKFTAFDSLMTQHILLAYSLGLLGFITVKILSTSFYSFQDIVTPIKISLIILVFSQIMNFLFVYFFEYIGIALSTSLSGLINAFLLYYELRKRNVFIPNSGWLIFLFRIFFSVIVMSGVLFICMYFMPSWEIGNFFYKIFRLFLLCFIGLITYLLMLFLLKLRISDFTRY